MIEEPLAFGHSFIHRLDPANRIIGAMVLSVAAALCDNIAVLAGYFGICVLLAALARLSLKEILKRLKPLFWFLLMIWVMLPVTFDGEILYRFGILNITRPGVILCIKITIKSITILMVFTSLIATMTIASLGSGLHRLRVPDKLVFLLLMSYRYIAVIEDEYRRLLRAARFRGFTPRTNLHSYRTYAYLAGMLFVRASFRAQRVYQAMLCRGFRQKFHTLDVYAPNRLNSIFLMGVIAASTGLVFFERIWI